MQWGKGIFYREKGSKIGCNPCWVSVIAPRKSTQGFVLLKVCRFPVSLIITSFNGSTFKMQLYGDGVRRMGIGELEIGNTEIWKLRRTRVISGNYAK